jgi:hypothetical protein
VAVGVLVPMLKTHAFMMHTCCVWVAHMCVGRPHVCGVSMANQRVLMSDTGEQGYY